MRRIGLLGNTNNNNFALLRYFHDLGYDVTLILFDDDGANRNSHFIPQNDTFRWNFWRDSVVYKNFSMYDLLIDNSFKLRCLRGRLFRKIDKPTASSFKKELKKFDFIIGSGITPALLSNLGIQLSIFYPYSIGVEFVGSYEIKQKLKQKNPIKRVFTNEIVRLQKQGIRSAFKVINAEMGETERVLRGIRKNIINLPIPMVYLETEPKFRESTNNILQITSVTAIWINSGRSKNNHWIIDAINSLQSDNITDFRINLVKYGPDWVLLEDMISEAGLSKYFVWHDKMSRIEVQQLMSESDLILGEFYDEPVLWGGTGWEALSLGKLLLNGFNDTVFDFEGMFGMQTPPIPVISSKEDFIRSIRYFLNNPKQIIEAERKISRWSDDNFGLSLAKRWSSQLFKA